MVKNFIFHQKSWLTILITTYAIVGSCEGRCQKKAKSALLSKSSTAPTIPTTPPITRIVDKLNTANLNGTTDSNASSASLTPPPPPTDFAGLPNLGSTCYMNAVLQIIAALYEDEVSNGPLKELIKNINTGSKPLDHSAIEPFINSLPEQAKKMARSGQQEDPDEFIDHIKEYFLCLGQDPLYPITCTASLFLKVKGNQENTEEIYKYNGASSASHMLAIPIKKGIANLTEMIKRYQEQLVKQEEAVDIDWKNISLCKGNDLPVFIETNQGNINPVVQGSSKSTPKDYIKQIMLKLPDRLYIKLDRNPNEAKIADPVHGTMQITIHPNPNEQATVSFDLNGFIVHYGAGTSSGHYVAYVKRKGKWYKADDRAITEVQASQATDASKEAYLLFYTQQVK